MSSRNANYYHYCLYYYLYCYYHSGKNDFGVSGDAILLNRYVTSGKEFGLVFSTGQYCLLVGAWGTDFFFYGGHTGQGAN